MMDAKELPEPTKPEIAERRHGRPVFFPNIESAMAVAVMKPLPKPAEGLRPNPFVLLEEANGGLAAFHERLQKLVERLAGPTPPFEVPGLDKNTGLLGLSSSVSRSMSARLEHCQRLLDQVEEHLQ